VLGQPLPFPPLDLWRFAREKQHPVFQEHG